MPRSSFQVLERCWRSRHRDRNECFVYLQGNEHSLDNRWPPDRSSLADPQNLVIRGIVMQTKCHCNLSIYVNFFCNRVPKYLFHSFSQLAGHVSASHIVQQVLSALRLNGQGFYIFPLRGYFKYLFIFCSLTIPNPSLPALASMATSMTNLFQNMELLQGPEPWM